MKKAVLGVLAGAAFAGSIATAQEATLQMNDSSCTIRAKDSDAFMVVGETFSSIYDNGGLVLVFPDDRVKEVTAEPFLTKLLTAKQKDDAVALVKDARDFCAELRAQRAAPGL